MSCRKTSKCHTTFRLAFSNAGLLDDVTLAWLNRLQVRSCILLLCNAASLSSRELEQRLGRNQTYLLNRYLSPLVAEGLLERVGMSLADPNLRYRTTDRAVPGWKCTARNCNRMC